MVLWSLRVEAWPFAVGSYASLLRRDGRARRWAVVHEFLLFEQRADALQPPNLLRIMEQDPVGMNFEMVQAALAQLASELGFVRAVGFLDVQDEFVQFVRVVVNLAQLDLPGAHLWGVVEDVLEF